MYSVKVVLDTQKAISDFVNIASTIEEEVYLEDGTGLRVNAKSLMGVMYGTNEFNDLYTISKDEAITLKFNKFTV